MFSILCLRNLGKANSPEPALPRPAEIFHAISAALRSRSYCWYASCIGLVWMSYFAFLALSPAFFQHNYGVSGIHYGLFMILPAVGYWFGGYLIKHTQRPTTLSPIIMVAAGGFATFNLLLAALAPQLPAPMIVVLLSIQFIGVGVSIPYAQNGQLGLPLPHVGITTGLFFFLQMITGATYTAVANSLHATSYPVVVAFVVVPQLVLALMVLMKMRRQKKN